MDQLLQMSIEYIKPELIVLIPILTYIGTILKGTPSTADWKIPIYLMVVSLGLCLLYVTATTPFTLLGLWVALTQGVLIAALQSWGYTTYKQGKKKT